LMDFVAVCCLQCYHRLQQLRYYAHSRFVWVSCSSVKTKVEKCFLISNYQALNISLCSNANKEMWIFIFQRQKLGIWLWFIMFSNLRRFWQGKIRKSKILIVQFLFHVSPSLPVFAVLRQSRTSTWTICLT
jgi:hypothetical protein